MYNFILQDMGNGKLQEFAWLTRELIEAENQWNAFFKDSSPAPGIHYITADKSLIQEKFFALSDSLVPVGSIEFCSEALKSLGLFPVTALNIPASLQDMEITGRDVVRLQNYEELLGFLENQTLRDFFFVKPADFAKRFETEHVLKNNPKGLKEVPGPYFVSRQLPERIVAEWRVFFHRGRIIDAKPYALDEWVCPKREFVSEILKQWTDAPPAGTLDIAILQSGRNVLLETHQFISCGLYGFEDREILMMYQDAWRWELQEQKKKHQKCD